MMAKAFSMGGSYAGYLQWRKQHKIADGVRVFCISGAWCWVGWCLRLGLFLEPQMHMRCMGCGLLLLHHLTIPWGRALH